MFVADIVTFNYVRYNHAWLKSIAKGIIRTRLMYTSRVSIKSFYRGLYLDDTDGGKYAPGTDGEADRVITISALDYASIQVCFIVRNWWRNGTRRY